MFKFFTNDRYQPYTFAIIAGIVIFFIEYFLGFKLPKSENITSLANIFITVISIFVWFLGVGLTLIYQSQENSNIKMLKANKRYNLLISYFKQAIIWAFISIIFWIFVSLGIIINWQVFISLLTLNALVLFLNYRIIHFLFKILED